MMASSSMSSSCTEQTTTVVSPGESSSIITLIPVHIDEELKEKIIFIIQKVRIHDGESVVVLFWAAKEIKKYIFVLTTTCQPFRLSGNNKELHAFHVACLYKKLYVYRKELKEAAFGLAGMAYLYCTPQQTQNVHEYHEDHHHSTPCEHAIFTKKWGSYAVPVINANKCVGVLEVVTDTPRDYSNDITVAKGVIEDAGLQTTMQIDSTMRTYIRPKERSRITSTSPFISYCCLNKYFGLSSARAKKALEGIIKDSMSDGTFTNLCRSAGIPEWPCIIQKKTDRTFVILNDDPISILYEMMTTIPSAQEIRTNPFASETSGDTRDWNESEPEPEPELEPEPEHAHPSHMAAIGDLMENQDNNIYLARVHLDSMDIDHLGADPTWDEGLPGEEIMTTIPSAQEIQTNPFASGDTGDWNESESEHAHPSLMATIGDLMENQDNNINPARVHLDSMDIDHLRADPLWCENIYDWSGEHTMTSGDSEAWLSGFAFQYNNAPVANHGSMDDIGDFDIDSM